MKQAVTIHSLLTGQHLLPYGSQAQYKDMWILSLPSFTWIKVDQSDQNVPYGRSGATCDIWDAQMVMVGGYIGDTPLSCEYPGIYVLNLNTVEWQSQFTSLDGDDSSVSSNPLNQQSNQKSSENDRGGLEGSYGYEVPEVIIKVIGGDKYGGATLTTPVVTPTAGPLATGSPATYTVTKSNGEVVTATPGPSGLVSVDGGNDGPNIAAIVVGVVCGVLFIVICYLLFCLFIYRKQLRLYKRHVEMSQAQARGEKPPEIPGLWMTESGNTSDQPPPKLGTPADTASGPSSKPSGVGSNPQTSSTIPADHSARTGSQGSSTEDLLAGKEPTFVGVMLNPRRSLRVINRD